MSSGIVLAADACTLYSNQMNRRLTISNARAFYAQDDFDLEESIGPVFERFRDPQTDARWVEAYLVSRRTTFNSAVLFMLNSGDIDSTQCNVYGEV